MPQTKEERKEYLRLYNLKNKEKIKEKKRLWYIKNKEAINEISRLYHHEHKEKLNKISKLYYEKKGKLYLKTSDGLKIRRIRDWRRRGVFDHFNDNFETLYKIYQSTKFCENCNVELNIEGDDRTRKCLDHCHQSGYFRNILCHCCNVRRG